MMSKTLKYQIHLKVAEDDMDVEAEASTKSKGEAEVKAGLQHGGNKVTRRLGSSFSRFALVQDSDAVELDVTTKEKDAAKMRPLHADSMGQDKYGLFNADAWIKKNVVKKKKKKSGGKDAKEEEKKK